MLRQFAWLWLAFFGATAAWQGIMRGRVGLALALAALALTIGLAGLIRPQLVRPVFVAWMVLAFPIGWTISQVVLALIFYGLMTPIGLVFRLVGRDPLHRAWDPGMETYWSPKVTPADPRQYFKQY